MYFLQTTAFAFESTLAARVIGAWARSLLARALHTRVPGLHARASARALAHGRREAGNAMLKETLSDTMQRVLVPPIYTIF